MLASVLRAGSKCVCEPALLARLILSSQGASMTSNMKHGPPVRITCSGRASSPVIWSAAVGFVLVPDMRSAWALSWASLGMYGACEHESFCCVRACSAFCQMPPHVGASWSKYGRWELRSAADEGLCHGFSQNCLVCRFFGVKFIHGF